MKKLSKLVFTAYRFLLPVPFLSFINGCGSLYYHNLPDIYEPYRLHLGEPTDSIGARSAALAGAGRASEDTPAAVVNNPAGLTNLEGLSVEAGLGYENRAIIWQADPSYPKAESYTNSFAGTYASFGTPLIPGRLAVAVAYWTPYDLKLTAGNNTDSGYAESRGGIRSITPGVGVALGRAGIGVSLDILWGHQNFSTSSESVNPFDANFTGYDLRGGFQYELFDDNTTRLLIGALARRGARVNVSDAGKYSVSYAPELGGAASIRYKNISGHADLFYDFAEKMASENTADDSALNRMTRDSVHVMVGAEYSIGNATVRGGYAVKPHPLRDGSRNAVSGHFYAFGGGWTALNGRGAINIALTYGNRGSITVNKFDINYIDFKLSVTYGR